MERRAPSQEEMEERLGRALSQFEGKERELIPLLQRVQEELGYLPDWAMERVAKFCGVPESRVYGVASFYAQFSLVPKGRRKIAVCCGTACHVRGSPRILEELKQLLGIEEGETTPDMEYSLETVACIGCCALAPCVVIDGEVIGKMKPEKVYELLWSEGGGKR